MLGRLASQSSLLRESHANEKLFQRSHWGWWRWLGGSCWARLAWPDEFLLQNSHRIERGRWLCDVILCLCTQLLHAFLWLIKLWSSLFLPFYFSLLLKSGLWWPPVSAVSASVRPSGGLAAATVLWLICRPELIRVWWVWGPGPVVRGKHFAAELYSQCEFDIDYVSFTIGENTCLCCWVQHKTVKSNFWIVLF